MFVFYFILFYVFGYRLFYGVEFYWLGLWIWEYKYNEMEILVYFEC